MNKLRQNKNIKIKLHMRK